MNVRIRMVSLEAIQRLAAEAVASAEAIPAFAGTAIVQPAPNGLRTIISRSGSATLGSTGGLTLIKNAAAFTIPSFVTQNSAVRQGSTVQHYAQVQTTTSGDATHDCYYPAPGDHVRPGMTQRISGQQYTHFWRISRQISELIRQGEEEHLADAQRAYELVYKLIADTINSMVGRRFGPASTPAEATRLAGDRTRKQASQSIGGGPAELGRVARPTARPDPGTRPQELARDQQRPAADGWEPDYPQRGHDAKHEHRSSLLEPGGQLLTLVWKNRRVVQLAGCVRFLNAPQPGQFPVANGEGASESVTHPTFFYPDPATPPAV